MKGSKRATACAANVLEHANRNGCGIVQEKQFKRAHVKRNGCNAIFFFQCIMLKGRKSFAVPTLERMHA